MKKISSIFCMIALAGALGVVFTACAEPNKQEQPKEQEEPKEPELPEEKPGIIIIVDQPKSGYEIYKETEQPDAYYCNGDKRVPLITVAGKYHVMFLSENEAEFKDALAKAGAEIYDMDIPPLPEQKIRGDHKTATVEGDFEKIEEVLSLTFYWEPYYRLYGYTQRVWSDGKFCVRLKSEDDYPVLEEMAVKHGVEIVEKDTFVDGLYWMACTNNSKGNAVEMANFFHETGLFEFADPNLAGLFVID